MGSEIDAAYEVREALLIHGAYIGSWQHASWSHAHEIRETMGNTPFSISHVRVFPDLVVDLSKPGAGTAPIALPQDQGVALEDPQPASRVQDSAKNEICSWLLDANGSFFGVFDPPPKGPKAYA